MENRRRLPRLAAGALGVGLLAASLSWAPDLRAQDRIRVVATLPAYGSIAREITGDRAEVTSIARGDQDAHFVNPRPSFAAELMKADLFITTGLDLELWVPALLVILSGCLIITNIIRLIRRYTSK